MKDPIIAGLHSQYIATTEMLAPAIEHCPDEFWTRVFGNESPFWKEAYHMWLCAIAVSASFQGHTRHVNTGQK